MAGEEVTLTRGLKQKESEEEHKFGHLCIAV